mgnify:CR=1 FL=1
MYFRALAEEQARQEGLAKEAARKADLARQEELAAQAAAERAAELERQAQLARQEEAKKQVKTYLFCLFFNNDKYIFLLNNRIAKLLCVLFSLFFTKDRKIKSYEVHSMSSIK